LDSIIGVVKVGLNRKTFCPEAISCVSMLALAVGSALDNYMLDLLSTSLSLSHARSLPLYMINTPTRHIALMFDAGLNSRLPQCLSELVQHVPAYLATIQERLLDLLSMVLSGNPYYHPGTPMSFRIKKRSPGPPVMVRLSIIHSHTRTPVLTSSYWYHDMLVSDWT